MKCLRKKPASEQQSQTRKCSTGLNSLLVSNPPKTGIRHSSFADVFTWVECKIFRGLARQTGLKHLSFYAARSSLTLVTERCSYSNIAQPLQKYNPLKSTFSSFARQTTHFASSYQCLPQIPPLVRDFYKIWMCLALWHPTYLFLPSCTALRHATSLIFKLGERSAPSFHNSLPPTSTLCLELKHWRSTVLTMWEPVGDFIRPSRPGAILLLPGPGRRFFPICHMQAGDIY